MKKIAIQTFKNSAHAGRGVGVYGAELVNALANEKEFEIIEFSELSELEGKEIDLIHFLVFDLYQRSLPASINIPFVVTIHDLTPLVFAKQYPAGLKGKVNLFFQKKAIKKAGHIITDSEASKKDITKILKIKSDDVSVVYLGVGKQFKKITDKNKLTEIKHKFKLPENYAFYSGNVNWNKNILGMAESCIQADIDLVIVGKSFEKRDNLDHPEMKSYKEFLAKYADNPKVHILGFVDDEEMVALLNLATLSIYVSYYEGFGFPILEAQACETPVITAITSSMPEVGGEGALYVDPYNTKEITETIKILLTNEDIRNDLIKKGTTNVQKFSWQKCAKETAAVYKKILT